MALKSKRRHLTKPVIASVLADKKTLEIKTIEILWTDTNLFTTYFLPSADNHTCNAYKMVDSIAALYKFFRATGLRPQVILSAQNNFVEYFLVIFTLLSTWSFQSNFLFKIKPKYFTLSRIGIF